MMQGREATRDEIARRAYELYLMRGCEHGRDVEDWVQAKKQLSSAPVGQRHASGAAHEAASHNADLRSAWPEMGAE
jgi:hypothetical protein